MKWNELHKLTKYSYQKLKTIFKGSQYYMNKPVYDGENLLGHKILHRDGDPSMSIFIPCGGRLPLSECIAMDFQCCHEIANDGKFDLNKWGTRYLCDQTYGNVFGDFGYHNVTRYSSDAVVHSAENTNNGESVDVGDFIEENKISIPPTDCSNSTTPLMLYNKSTMSF